MKIMSHNASTYQTSWQNTEKNSKKELVTEKKALQDSLALNTKQNTLNIKETNKAIGTLQAMNRALAQLDTQIQSILHTRNNPQDTQKQMQKILNTTFNGEKIFDQDLTKLSSDIKLNTISIKKYAQNISDNPDLNKLNNLSNEIKKERNQTNNAIKILQNQLNNTLNTNTSFDTLDTTKLANLANAHNTKSLSLSRVSELLA